MRATIRRSEDRGRADFGWLDSRHSFSFGNYFDPEHMGFGPLRVINEDRVAGGGGFPTHPHADMEILSYVLSGALAHKDSLGNGSEMRAGDVQRMTAGTGIRHSEYNASPSEPVHFLQIWIIPERRGLSPSYEQKTFPRSEKLDRLRLIASRNGRDGSTTLHQDVDLYATVMSAGTRIELGIARGRVGWVQVVTGAITCGATRLAAGDGLAIESAGVVELAAEDEAEVLLFDMIR